MAKADFRFHTTIRVRWSECDAQGIVFNGAYQDYLEMAQAEYYRNFGISFYHPDSRKRFDTATVKITLEYIAPARVDDLLDVFCRVKSIGTTSLTSRYEMYRSGTGELVHRAEVVHVDYDADAERSRPIPDGLRALIETFESTGAVRPLSEFPDLRGLMVG